MDRKTDRIFFKSGASYMTVLIAGVFLFLSLCALQLMVSTITKFFIGVSLMLLSFMLNVFLGKLGFYISFVLNFMQCLIHTYEYLKFGNQNAAFLAAMAFTTMMVNLLMQYYITRVAAKITRIAKEQREERGRRINKELEEEMFKRTSLIVSHERSGSSTEVTEAIGRNIASSLDPLTTLPSRDMITERISRLIADDINAQRESRVPDSECSPFTVIYLALDNSEMITRRIGHNSMDLFIQNMAHKIREAADPSDMVARIVDSDFLILERRKLPLKDLNKYADKLTREASRAFEAGSDSMNVNISYGFAMYPQDSRNASELITKAEEAMIGTPSSKSEQMLSGDNIFDGMTKDDITAVFDNAIRNGDIYMVYQPCYSSERELLGFEAFMRFEKDDVFVSPQVFIAAAENTGYMRRIGKFSMLESLNTLSEINKINPKLTMSVNISANQLKEENFVRSFMSTVAASDCDIKNIILDLPEESLITELSGIRSVIEELAGTGVRIALDNFGRGYSSFNAIPLLPVSVLKLDGNFTSDLANNSDVRILTASAIDLMHDTDIRVCATGVGEEIQFEILSGYGCDAFQGKFLGSVMRNDALKDFISK
ncbi:MAG: bifunctional diguanylate cyclase/phosphodiesterase [Clostridiales bacterium]|nr:bifunctional diguanylate cyclase/phosphodiesterase [Clostridiales bacterium]